ncbi:MAG: phage tail tape measure protein [FCB group bacterium]|nr:phage tail tape measure protein [FCB group bacterium]
MPATTTDTLIFEFKVEDKASKAFDAWEKRLKALEKQLKETFSEKDIDGFSEALGEEAKEGAEAIKKSFSGLDRFGATLFKGFLSAARSAFGILGRIASAAFGALVRIASAAFRTIGDLGQKALKGLQDAFVDTVKDASSFEDSMIVARRTMELTAAETKELGDGILQLGTELGGVSADTLGEIAGIAGTLGIRGKENVLEFVDAIAKIDVATDIAASTAAQKIPAILTLYKVSTNEMGAATKDFGNVINELGNNLNATQNQILNIASAIGGTLATSRFTVNEMLALSGAVASVEKRFGTAGSAIAQIITRMSRDYSTFADVLKLDSEELRKNIEENPTEALKMLLNRIQAIGEAHGPVVLNQVLQDLGMTGVRATDVMKKMGLAVGEFDKALLLANDSLKVQNSLDREFTTAMGTLTLQWTAFGNTIDNIQKVIGGPVINAFTSLLQGSINPLVAKVFEWIQQSQLVGEIIPQVMGDITGAMNFAVQAAAEFAQSINWEEAVNRGKELWDSLVQKVTEGYEYLRDNIGFDVIMDGFSTAVDIAKGVWNSFVEIVLSLYHKLRDDVDWDSVVSGLKDALNSAVEFVKKIDLVEVWESMHNAATVLFTFLTDTLPDIVKLATELWQAFKAFEPLLGPLFKGLSRAIHVFIREFTIVIDKVKGFIDLIKDAWYLVKRFFGDIKNEAEPATLAIRSVATATGEATEAMETFEDAGVQSLENVAGSAAALESALDSASDVSTFEFDVERAFDSVSTTAADAGNEAAASFGEGFNETLAESADIGEQVADSMGDIADNMDVAGVAAMDFETDLKAVAAEEEKIAELERKLKDATGRRGKEMVRSNDNVTRSFERMGDQFVAIDAQAVSIRESFLAASQAATDQVNATMQQTQAALQTIADSGTAFQGTLTGAGGSLASVPTVPVLPVLGAASRATGSGGGVNAPQTTSTGKGGGTASTDRTGSGGGAKYGSGGGVTTNVVFQGQNIVDDSTRTRFVRQITREQQNLAVQIIKG